MESTNLTFSEFPFLKELGLSETNNGVYRRSVWGGSGEEYTSINPHNNKPIAKIRLGTEEEYEDCIKAMEEEKVAWMKTPAPVRGEIVRQIGDAFRAKKEPLGMLISLEMGKIISEGLGEVQEFIDICDMATGMSRTLEGKVLQSERPGHFMMEMWNPIGIIGCITAFNFPCAVAGWNAAIAFICGDLMIWKGAETTSLISIATTKIVAEVLEKNGFKSVLTLCQGLGPTIGSKIVNDPRVALVSFTGSTAVGRMIGTQVQKRFGKTILELGGNNAAIIMDDADQELALKACVFAAVGTCGQRCTSLRRIYLHESLYDKFVERMVSAYKTIKVGSPLENGTLCGPLHNKNAVKFYEEGVKKIKEQGGNILVGGNVIPGEGNYVEPTIVEMKPDAEILQHEIFAPIVHVIKFKTLEEAISYNNSVPQGLSSTMFSKNL